ncbi:MAG TPA: GIY-YIG nuclease family protein [bacterium]|nr:GIY-YIG nuclease family protein [bacterium]
MDREKLKKKIQTIPDTTGVYVFKDKNRNVIYVGKAKHLSSRIRSYFSRPADYKKTTLADEIADIEVIPVVSEGEALLLECCLIKKHQPRYNVDLKDGKTYPYLKITDERFPSVLVVREKKNNTDEYFGPFTDVKTLKHVLRFIRNFYPVRDCRKKIAFGKSTKPCMAFYTKKCCGPCRGNIIEKNYKKNIAGIRAVFSGKYKNYRGHLKKQLDIAVKRWNFEEAKILNERIQMLEKMESHLPWRDEEELLLFRTKNVLPSLASMLGLNKIPAIIEGYDISHISGSNATGGRVVFKGGLPFKEGYRRFRIKTVKGIDDCRMLREVLRRRFTDSGMKEKPDLILIDGGKGQLTEARKELLSLHIDIPVIALAKKEEIIYSCLNQHPIILSDDSEELHLLQHIRDEAHRFARHYHLGLRSLFKKNHKSV